MRHLLGIALLFANLASFFAPTNLRIDVRGQGSHACVVYYVVQQKYNKGWSTAYRTITKSKYQCCAGWQTSNGVNCDLAVCDSKTNLNSACHRWVAPGLIVKPDGSSVTFSDGSCFFPQKCKNCVKGFWPKHGGPYCEVCPQIANCDFEDCSDTHEICVRCNGDYGMTNCNEASPKQVHGCSAFFTNPQKTVCMELCSWRKTSTACWPGECGKDGHKTDCKCHPWFTGPACMTTTKPPEILFVLIKLDKHLGGDRYRNLMQNDPNEVKVTRVYWTNAEVTHLDMKAKANHTANLSPRPNYVSKDRAKTNIGIVLASTTIISRRANGTEHTSAYPLCGGKSFVAAPEGKVPVHCQAWEVLGGKNLQHVIEHGASLDIEVVYVAGGFVTIIDLDRGMNNAETRHNYIEIPSKYKTTFKWDLHKPYSTSKDHLRLSTEKAKISGQTITATWQGWTDDDSQVHPNVTVGVTRLEAVGKELKDYCGGGEEIIPTAEGSRSIVVTKPGVYSVILTVSDIAGNHERSRRFFTYDPGSKLQTMAGTNATFSSAASNTSFNDQWQHNTDIAIHVVYTISEGHFINPNHTHGNWLGAIRECHGMNNTYDDNDRLRTTSSIRNNQGVVKMEIGYLQYRSLIRPSTPVPYKPIDINTTTNSFNIARKDGDTIEMFIKVTDYMDRFFVESKKVRIDSSPPVILNVGLWRERVKRLAVHNSTELRTMTVEWWAFDYDTCLKQVEWTIYDNHTSHKDVVYHGHQKVGHQGLHEDLAACKKEYFDAPYGPDCYPTIYHGACHKHFRVTPQVSTGGLNGLHPDRKEALHDVDLFINITVINWANLKSTFVKKIAIDTSPPRRGVVHDGLQGGPDVDYQSSRNLTAYWDGFFDHESGIIYFQYAWGTFCQGSGVFGIDYDSAKVTKTTQNTAQWKAPTTGKYFITVVAFNAALDHSEPVCSNGVMVDETGPVMGGLTIENTVTKPGLVKQGGKVYYVRKDRRKVEIIKPSSICRAKAAETMDITIYPDGVLPNGTLVTKSTEFCERQSPLSLTAVTPLTNDFYISANWTAHDGESGIQSYEFGLMSNKGASAAPDILPYTQTDLGNLGHFKQYHPALTAGRVFYVGLRAMNKALLTTEKVFGPFVVDVTPPTFTENCSAGTYLSSSKTTCILCPRNEYQPFADRSECLKCDPDHVTKSIASISKSQCIKPGSSLPTIIGVTVSIIVIIAIVVAIVILLHRRRAACYASHQHKENGGNDMGTVMTSVKSDEDNAGYESPLAVGVANRNTGYEDLRTMARVGNSNVDEGYEVPRSCTDLAGYEVPMPGPMGNSQERRQLNQLRPQSRLQLQGVPDDEFKSWLFSKQVTEETYDTLVKHGFQKASMFAILEVDSVLKLSIQPLAQELLVQRIIKSFNTDINTELRNRNRESIYDDVYDEIIENPYTGLYAEVL